MCASCHILRYAWCEMGSQQLVLDVSTRFSWVSFCKIVSSWSYRLNCVGFSGLFCLRVKSRNTWGKFFYKNGISFTLWLHHGSFWEKIPLLASQINWDFTDMMILRQVQLYSSYLHEFLDKMASSNSILNPSETHGNEVLCDIRPIMINEIWLNMCNLTKKYGKFWGLE